MSETVASDQSSKSEPFSEAAVEDPEKFDGSVEEADTNNVDANVVTSSSPENVMEESDDFLPFQTLAVELKEGDGSASPETIITNEPSESANAPGSSEDTVLSNEVFTTEHFDGDVITPSANNTEDFLEHTATSNGDTEQDGTAVLIPEASALQPEVEDDAAMDFNTSMYLQQHMEEDEQKNAKTYLEDFLLSSGPSSSTIPYDSDSASNDEKGLPLHRFPKIVKAMEEADYSILQVLYRLLYLRNAWDTESILTQRILEFSGFDCDPTSEDFYTREVILRTMPCDVLLNIGKLLSLDISNTTDFDKLKIQIVSKIMSFLHRPKRRSRRPKPGLKRTMPVSRYTKSYKAVSSSKGSTQKEAELSNKDTKANPPNVNSISQAFAYKELQNAIKSSKPGPLCSKLKASGLSQEKIAELEQILKKNIQEGKAKVPKVDLKRLDQSVIDRFTECRAKEKKDGAVVNDTNNIDEEDTEDLEMMNKKSTDGTEGDSRKKLKEFQHVISSIEGTPDELLSEVYFLLFQKKGVVGEIKESILEFSGFPFDENSPQYIKRVNYLNRMSENVVKDTARALYLDPKIDKQDTITQLLEFLKKPSEEYLRPTVVAPGMLSDCDLDIEGMSDIDSDDSITCEIVPKRIECIDLLSSGEDSDKEAKVKPVTIKKEPPEKPVVKPASPASKVVAENTGKRTLRDFETITKIVNTHPTEYLVDIYNLLYMVPYEPSTLRKDILDFSGFEFEKGTTEYVKRKQFLDRMLYNSVRRIYNTLIHNTREVRVFSKPTMIGEIFQFLFKLPDTDTSIRLPPPKPSGITTMNLNALNTGGNSNKTNLNLANKNIPLQSQPGKLSDLKRVFQRVACFPCEYLVDVHKLLYMTDCDMKDIRANIFGFKGFSFGVDSPEFNQRKLYLEYLTFHSLRKISSVLTTKTVDLRNSTKHELASHLTEVLKEYTNTYFETQAIGTPATSTTASTVSNPIPTDSTVEQIVVTPIIPSFHQDASPSPDPPAEDDCETSDYSIYPGADDNMTVSSSTPATSTQSSPSSASKPNKFFKSKEKSGETAAKMPATVVGTTESSSYFQKRDADSRDKTSKSHKSSIKILPKSVTTLQQPVVSAMECQSPAAMRGPPPNAAPYGFRPEFVLQQVPSPYGPHIIPQGVPFIQTYPQPIHIQSPYVLPQPGLQLKKDDESCMSLRVDGGKDDSEPHLKRLKMMHDNPSGSVEGVRIVDSHSLADKKDDFITPASSFHLKIRDAMTKASEDEEDCDKPLSMLVGHPNDKVLKQQICEIVENTDLQEITINGVIQKIFSMYPKFNLNYRKEFIKSTLRSLLYRLGEQDVSSKSSAASISAKVSSDSPDCSVSTTDPRDSPEPNETPPLKTNTYKKKNATSAFQKKQSS